MSGNRGGWSGVFWSFCATCIKRRLRLEMTKADQRTRRVGSLHSISRCVRLHL
jgi:hypothetical protein